MDIRAKTADNTQLNIEVQLTNQYNMDKRTMFFWEKLFLEGIKKGEDYINLSKVITINILDFDYLDIGKFHIKYHLWEDSEENYLLADLIEIHFIEMPKFKRLKQKNLKGNPLHRWLSFFDKMLTEDELKELIEMNSALKGLRLSLSISVRIKKQLDCTKHVKMQLKLLKTLFL
ncbi:MAG TPA: Rpn family recombination-promoting nuclease/putative transposase [Pseudobacteroides sp.]|uniref:Rpn family recombination-promoting nuclease/putative transposase n=1 Tax=Pseudobacteroides sp. TaxID=1968840 RepID=UPI002F91E742